MIVKLLNDFECFHMNEVWLLNQGRPTPFYYFKSLQVHGNVIHTWKSSIFRSQTISSTRVRVRIILLSQASSHCVAADKSCDGRRRDGKMPSKKISTPDLYSLPKDCWVTEVIVQRRTRSAISIYSFHIGARIIWLRAHNLTTTLFTYWFCLILMSKLKRACTFSSYDSHFLIIP